MSKDVSVASDPVARAQSMFRHMLTGWAQDLLTLRSRGMDDPSGIPLAGDPMWSGAYSPVAGPTSDQARSLRAA